MNPVDTSKDVYHNAFRSWAHLTAVIISSGLMYALVRAIGFAENESYSITTIVVLCGILIPYTMSGRHLPRFTNLITTRRDLISYSVVSFLLVLNVVFIIRLLKTQGSTTVTTDVLSGSIISFFAVVLIVRKNLIAFALLLLNLIIAFLAIMGNSPFARVGEEIGLILRTFGNAYRQIVITLDPILLGALLCLTTFFGLLGLLFLLLIPELWKFAEFYYGEHDIARARRPRPK